MMTVIKKWLENHMHDHLQKSVTINAVVIQLASTVIPNQFDAISLRLSDLCNVSAESQLCMHAFRSGLQGEPFDPASAT